MKGLDLVSRLLLWVKYPENPSRNLSWTVAARDDYTTHDEDNDGNSNRFRTPGPPRRTVVVFIERVKR